MTSADHLSAGFHDGELSVQRRAGVEAEAAPLAPMLEPTEVHRGVAAFLAERTFAVIAARDHAGRLWASPLTGPAGFLSAPSPTTLQAKVVIPASDPLHGLSPRQEVGMIAIEFATRRRVRVNGTLAAADAGQLTVEVEQAYGNCPQYIQQRLLARDSAPNEAGSPPPRRGTALEAPDVALISAADTFFLGTAHPERGTDVSHRGGPPGFVRVDGNRLWWPDYPGNNMFNSFGNLAVDPEAALLFIDFKTGAVLHLSGTADVDWGQVGAAGDDGRTGRRGCFTLQRLVAGRTIHARETAHRPYPHNPRLTS
jgi:uncharacterized protein